MKAAGVTEPRNLEEQALALIGRDIYLQLIKGYTEKQWGRPCSELPAFIIRRLPVRLTFDNNYFNDSHQGIPIGGYNPLIDALLDGSDVLTGTDFFADRTRWEQMADKVVFTGCIDQYFGYCYGHLDYRTVRFETETIHEANLQATPSSTTHLPMSPIHASSSTSISRRSATMSIPTLLRSSLANTPPSGTTEPNRSTL